MNEAAGKVTAEPDFCDTCGHSVYVHEERESNSAVAPCKICWCMDFDNSSSDEASANRIPFPGERVRTIPDPSRDYEDLVDHLARKHDYRTASGQTFAGIRRVHEESHRFPRYMPHRHTHTRLSTPPSQETT